MLKKSGLLVFMAAALLVFASFANANVTDVPAGSSSVCEDASWIVYNVSETQDTVINFDIGPFAYSWNKKFKRTLPPGGYRTNAMARKSTIKNEGPGAIQVNCQRQRFDRNDWKIDAGSGKTYQSDYHMDHVKPGTYMEPGLGQPEGTEGRTLGDISASKPEWRR